MQQHRSRLLSTTYMTLALGSGLFLLGAGIAPGSSGLALAQCKAAVDCANPCNACNPCCVNPCAANPCNPCNPCAASQPCNPCNPCAANPCNPCKAG